MIETVSDVEPDRLATSRVVTTVFEQILDAIHRGQLLPGERISDADLAIQFGVSRTPVREALQRLREIGIIEASPSRFTRVADVTPTQTAQAYVVWLALNGALVTEVIPAISAEAVELLGRYGDDFLATLPTLDAQRIATTNFAFFNLLAAQSENPALQRSIVSVVHIIRLGSLYLPEFIDVQAIARAQMLLVAAARTHDLVPAREAMQVLGGITVPLV